MDNNFEVVQKNLLADMVTRRDSLNRAIADLTYELEHPLPPIKIDFEGIKRESQETMALLEKWKREREESKR